MSFPAYPEYKDSGWAWLGRVPEHWQLVRTGSLFTERREKANGHDYEPLSVSMNGVVPKLEQAAKSKDTENRKKVCCGDFVINSRSDRQGAAGISPKDGSVSLISVVMTPRGIVPQYAHYLLRSTGFQQEFYRRGKGIVDDLWSTGFRDIKNAYLPVPPVKEQRQIADFLDHETARIDALIEEQQRLTGLLEEESESYVFSVVSKGVGAATSTIDTGVPRLGQIPAHWYAAQLGVLSRHIQTGPFGSQLHSADYVEGGWPLINPANIQGGGIVPNLQATVSEETVERLQNQRLRRGDLIVGRRGLMGRAAVVTASEAGWLCGTGCLTLTPSERLRPEYLAMYLRSQGVQEALRVESIGSTMDNLNPEILSRIVVPVPPLEEQDAILKSVSDRKLQAERLLTEAKRGVSLLKERRVAIISAAVTGTIDVRGLYPTTSRMTGNIVTEPAEDAENG